MLPGYGIRDVISKQSSQGTTYNIYIAQIHLNYPYFRIFQIDAYIGEQLPLEPIHMAFTLDAF